MTNLSRRDFLRGLGAVGAAVALESVIGKGAPVQEQASDNSSMVDMPGPEFKCLGASAWAAEHWGPQSIFVIGTQGLLLVSPDGGKTWEKVAT
jgi:photosystem II stability/assembly factor-like uncharacterized protein